MKPLFFRVISREPATDAIRKSKKSKLQKAIFKTRFSLNTFETVKYSIKTRSIY